MMISRGIKKLSLPVMSLSDGCSEIQIYAGYVNAVVI